jgi:hypothetical protein
MASRLVRVHNPAEILTIVNPGGKRVTRTKTRNRPKRRTTNPRRTNRRRNTAAARSGHSVARVTNRRRNPRRRRSNPQVVGIVKGALFAAGGAILTNMIAGFIPLGGGGWMDIAKQLVAAYGAGWIAERFTSPANAQLVAIGGFASAAGNALNMAIGTAKGAVGSLLPGGGPALLAPPPDGVNDLMYGYDGMSDLVAVPDDFIQDYY